MTMRQAQAPREGSLGSCGGISPRMFFGVVVLINTVMWAADDVLYARIGTVRACLRAVDLRTIKVHMYAAPCRTVGAALWGVHCVPQRLRQRVSHVSCGSGSSKV